MAKGGPIPYLRRGRFAGLCSDPETGRIMVRVEWPDEANEVAKPRQPTQRQRMLIAIVRRRYRKGIPAGVSIADLHRLIDKKWEAECARQKPFDPQLVKAVPERDMVAYTLRDASLIP
jgi:hypothetical protein